MRNARVWSVLATVALSFGFCLMLVGILGASSAHAQGVAAPSPIAPMQPPGDDVPFITINVTRDPSVDVYGLDGHILGKGTHEGYAQCQNKCSRSTKLRLDDELGGAQYLYRFDTRLAFDPDERILITGGTGTIEKDGKKAKFAFTAAFQDNRDGTVSATYEASRPDASFFIPKTAGSMEIRK